MKAFYLFVALALAMAADREGNFKIRFAPKAILQTEAPIPFEIHVTNDLQHPVRQAKVTVQIEKDHKLTSSFKAPEVTAGVYLGKPVFPEPGEWSVQVEVRLNDEVSRRTLEYTVAK